MTEIDLIRFSSSGGKEYWVSRTSDGKFSIRGRDNHRVDDVDGFTNVARVTFLLKQSDFLTLDVDSQRSEVKRLASQGKENFILVKAYPRSPVITSTDNLSLEFDCDPQPRSQPPEAIFVDQLRIYIGDPNAAKKTHSKLPLDRIVAHLDARNEGNWVGGTRPRLRAGDDNDKPPPPTEIFKLSEFEYDDIVDLGKEQWLAVSVIKLADSVCALATRYRAKTQRKTKLHLGPPHTASLVVEVDKGAKLEFGYVNLPPGPKDAETCGLIAVGSLGVDQVLRALGTGMINPFQGHLRTVRGDRPISLLPEFEFGEPTDAQCCVLISSFPNAGSFVEGIGGVVRIDQRSWWEALSQVKKVNGDAQATEFQAGLRLDQFLRIDEKPISLACALEFSSQPLDYEKLRRRLFPGGDVWNQRAIQEELPSLDVKVSVEEVKPLADPGPPQIVRIGAFDLAFGGEVDQSAQAKKSLRLWLPCSAASASSPPGVFAFDVAMVLPLQDFSPGAQDVPEADEIASDRTRGNPVLIQKAVTYDKGPNPAAYELHVHETAFPGARQQVELELRAPRSGVQAKEIIVLDAEPFTVAKVEMPELRPTDETSVLAIWKSDGVEGASWQIRARQTGYDVTFPAQAVGEGTVKQTTVMQTNPPDVEVGKPIDFRIGPPARLKLFTTWRRERRGYVEPPTNLRRIFGDASQRAPGAPLVEASFELLYGMSARVAGRDDLLVTELTADLGALPAPLDETRPDWDLALQPLGVTIDDMERARSSEGDGSPELVGLTAYWKYRDFWTVIRRAFSRRLGVFALRPAGATELGNLEHGLTFELRRSAEIRQPVDFQGPDGVPPDGPPYNADGKRAGLAPADLLAGGSDWGFESTEIYESVWKRPKTDAGEIAGVHFSALGGWGYQKAAFDNRRTSIISRSAMGRTFFYSLERVGRIGVFWNRAKHVVVYERTVLPGDQFAGVQEAHWGRPLVRKVREFVEILQPERPFPEDDRAKLERGPVLGTRFRSTLIPVDSGWGHDLPGLGWQVPLWNPAANPSGASEAAPVYPKPQIELVLAADPNSGSGSVNVPLAAPQQLRFFASTRPADDDQTDRWEAVPGIDFPDLPLPEAPDLPPLNDGDPDATLPSPSPVEAGLEQFTFELERVVEQGANLVAERVGDNAISAVLRNVTLMRGLALDVGAETQKRFDLARTIAQVPITLDRITSELRQRLAHLRDREVTGVKSQIEEEVKKGAQKAQSAITSALEKVNGDLGKVFQGGPCALIRKKAEDALKQATTRLLAELDGNDPRSAAGRFIGSVATLSGELNERKAKAKGLVSELLGRVRFLVAGVGNELAETDGLGSGLVAFIDDFKTSTNRRIERRRGEFLAVAAKGQEELLVSLDRLKRDLGGELDAAIDAAARSIGPLAPQLAEKLARLKTDIRSSMAGKIEGAIAKFRSSHSNEDQLRAALEAALTAMKTAVEEAAGNLKKKVEDLLGPLKGKADYLQGKLRDVDDVFKKLEAGIHQELDSASNLSDAARQAIGDIQKETKEQLGSIATETLTAVDDLCPDVIGDNEYFKGIRDQLEDWKEALEEKLLEEISRASASVGELLEGIEGTLGEARGDAERFANRLTSGMKELYPEDVARVAGPTLSLVRAFGDAPRLPSLDFNRKDLAYYFDPNNRAVLTTPVTAFVDRVGQDLKALGIRLPTRELADRFVPDIELPKLDLGKLFPDIAGIRLDRLLPDLKVPAAARGKLKVSHGFNPETRRGWVDARVEALEIAARAKVFDLGPVAVGLRQGTFNAETRVETGLEGRTEGKANGRIDGNWDIAFGGQNLVTFRNTPLSFSTAGGLKFNLRPENAELSGAVQFLDGFVKSLGSEGEGLRLSTVKDGNTPVGFEALLDLALPPMVQGTFGISGLRLTTGIQLRAYPQFEIRSFFGLGSRTEPFTITVFILGGAGWLEGAARYLPSTGKLQVDLSVAIGASAAIGFNFGAVNGGVQLFFGINAELHTHRAGSAGLNLAIVLLATGCVRVLNLITVGISLLLEARVEEGKAGDRPGHCLVPHQAGFLQEADQRQGPIQAGRKWQASGGRSEWRLLGNPRREIPCDPRVTDGVTDERH